MFVDDYHEVHVDSPAGYSSAWGDYRRRRLTWIGATVSMAFVAWILVRAHPSDAVIILVFVPFLVVWFASWFWILSWRCPRCRNLFFVRFPAGWHHVAAQRQGDSLRLFVDGRLVAESNAARVGKLAIGSDQPWRIGAGSGDFFNGSMADVRVYRRSLTIDEIDELARPN